MSTKPSPHRLGPSPVWAYPTNGRRPDEPPPARKPHGPDPAEYTLTTPDVAARLGVPAHAVQTLVRRSLLHPIAVGHRRRYRPDEVEALARDGWSGRERIGGGRAWRRGEGLRWG